MARTAAKITLSPSRDIPLDRLVLSQSNVRRVKAGVSIDALADDIDRRGLLQSLNVRPLLGADGQETGRYEIPAGGRRHRALELLVKRKRLAKDAPIPCVVRAADNDILAEEDSLAENSFREQLHPLDEFRAMLAMVEKDTGIEEIAAHFHTTPAAVRQRLKLAGVSPKLHTLYADDAMTLDQLMAFTVSSSRESCVQVSPNRVYFTNAPTNLRDCGPAQAIDARAAEWKERLPQSDKEVWDYLLTLDGEEQTKLFAHCASLCVNAQAEIVPKYDNGRISAHGVERRIAHSHILARAVGLDVHGAGWRPTADDYFRSVTKPRILADVAEARGEAFARMIDHLKKADMAREAERLVEETRWLPAPMRTPGLDDEPDDAAEAGDIELPVAAE